MVGSSVLRTPTRASGGCNSRLKREKSPGGRASALGPRSRQGAPRVGYEGHGLTPNDGSLTCCMSPSRGGGRVEDGGGGGRAAHREEEVGWLAEAVRRDRSVQGSTAEMIAGEQ